MKVKESTVRHVARTARLELTDKEVKMYSKDLGSILKAFETLQKIDTKGVAPTFQPIDVKDVLREDRIEPSIPRDRLLKNLKNKEKGYIKGPKVV